MKPLQIPNKQKARGFALIFASLSLLSISCQSAAPSHPILQAHQTVEGRYAASSTPSKVLPYDLLTYFPKTREEKFSLILVMHGAGMDGRRYFESWVEEAVKRRIMILAPHRGKGYRNEKTELKEFEDLIREIEGKYPVDPRSIYLAGVSSGALIARWLLVMEPSFWKGAILIASEPYEDWTSGTDVHKLPPLFYIHGTKDPGYPVSEVRKKVALLKRLGADVDLKIDSKAGHEHRPEWNPAIFKWVERQEKKSKKA